MEWSGRAPAPRVMLRWGDCQRSIDGCHDGHRYWQEFVPRRRPRSTRRNRIEAEVVARPGRSAARGNAACLIGMEACVGAHHLTRKLQALGHDARLMPAKYVRPYKKGQKNDFRDAEAIAEAVQRPTMKFVHQRRPISSTCRRRTGCVNGWSASAPASSIRFAPSCWNVGLRCARDCAFCAPNCRASSLSAPTRCSRA